MTLACKNQALATSRQPSKLILKRAQATGMRTSRSPLTGSPPAGN